MKNRLVSLSPRAALFIGAALLSTPAWAQDTTVTPPPVVSTVPAVLAGVVVTLALTGTTLNVQSFMGAIMATGVAVANAILLVTFAEHARREGGSPLHTAIEAARSRMRPVLMTSAAMVLGMAPTAISQAEGSEFRSPMAIAVIGGVISSTLLSLIVVPVFYLTIENIKARLKRFMQRLGVSTSTTPAPTKKPFPTPRKNRSSKKSRRGKR